MKNLSIIYSLLLSFIFAQAPLNNLTNQQLNLIKDKVMNPEQELNNVPESSFDETGLKSVTINSMSPTLEDKSVFFGYNYFLKDVNIFDNIPTPKDYQLGPGDEIVLSLWGETNSRESFIINKDGLIYYPDLGFISIASLTIVQAEKLLLSQLSKIYSKLLDGSTGLKIELLNLKSINVYFTGQVNTPGMSLIHPFSDIFSALVQVGGIKESGSLREIKIIRSGEVLASVDFYSFFSNGDENFSNIKLIDGDIIHVPPVKTRVEIAGSILNEGFFEVIDGESIQEIINYAGGLKSDAGTSAVLDQIIPFQARLSDDNSRKSKNINIDDFANEFFNNGDLLTILSISSVESKVEVIGRVKNPGFYSASSNLKEILKLAGGFEDPDYKQSINTDKIVILRKNNKMVYSEELSSSYQDSNNFLMNPGDKVLVYENSLYDKRLIYFINGEVHQAGAYILSEDETISSAIKKAGGISKLGDSKNIDYFLESNEEVFNINQNTKVLSGSTITVNPKINYFYVEGNVYNPGPISLNQNLSFSTRKALELAGGPKKNSEMRKVYIVRSNGKIIKNSNTFSRAMSRVYAGDKLVVPLNENPSQFEITQFISDLASTLANIAAILVIIDNQKAN